MGLSGNNPSAIDGWRADSIVSDAAQIGFNQMHLTSNRAFPLFVLLLLCMVGSASVIANPTKIAGAPSSVAELKTKRSNIDGNATLDDAAKIKIAELYEQAIQARTQADKLLTDYQALKSRVEAAPNRLNKLRKQLAKEPSPYDPVSQLSKRAGIDEVGSLLRQEEVQYEAYKASIKIEENTLARLLDGVAHRSKVMANLTGRLENLDADLKAAPASDELPALTTARREALLARKGLRMIELDFYRLQMDNHELLTSLAVAERDFATRESSRLLPGLEALRGVAQKLREASAAKVMEKAERAQQETVDLPGPIRFIAEKSVELSVELQDLTRNEALVIERLDLAHRKLDEIKSEAESTRQRVEVVGPSEAIGRMLRKRAAALPSLESYRLDTRERQAEINRATDRQIDIDELRRDLLSIEERVQDTLQSIEQRQEPIPSDEKAQQDKEERRLSKETRDLLIAQRDTLAELHKVYGRYISRLAALDVAERQLVSEAEKFIAFIDERLIWIRSTKPIAFSDLPDFASSLIWLISPADWGRVMRDGFSTVQGKSFEFLLGLLTVVVLLLLRPFSKRQISDIAKQTRTIHTASFGLTLRALSYTLILTAGGPAVIFLIAWSISAAPSAAPYSLAMGEGFYAAGMMLLMISFFRQACRADGLGERHFRWPNQIKLVLLKNLTWLQVLWPLLILIITATQVMENEAYVQGLGRPAFIVMMVAILVFGSRMLGPSGPVQTHMRGKALERKLRKIRLIWLPIVIVLPLSMMLASLMGYHHTALVMEQHLESMIWFLLGLMILRDLLLRALYLAEIKFRYEEALKKREELRAQREKEAAAVGDEDSVEPVVELPEIEYEEIDYGQLSEQARRLLQTGLFIGAAVGLWVIWVDMLPILGFLDAVTLPFTSTELVDGIEKVVPVTLADLALGLLYLALTAIAAKNLPGLMEIVFLQRLSLDPGARYATKALTQYLIVAIGIVTAFNTIGAEWTSIQWLIAALSVGLGFGLQEIVANFISGIILLFEQPIRVGDTVTVGDTTGKVSRIRIRATTILNWDKQELLVPNKEFITSRLLNWTLTD